MTKTTRFRTVGKRSVEARHVANKSLEWRKFSFARDTPTEVNTDEVSSKIHRGNYQELKEDLIRKKLILKIPGGIWYEADSQ